MTELASSFLTQALATARTVVGEASELVASSADHVGTVRHKSNVRDLVTEWDTRSEELIVRRLAELSPGIPLLGEEGGAHGVSDGDTRWLIDPIDGTVNFAHGLPFYAVTVALEHAGRPVVGVVRAPALGWEFYAAEGQGAFCNGERLQVSAVDGIERAILATGFPYDRATSGHNFREWEHFQRTAGACRRFGAASLDLCMVARGWLDGYWESRLSPWDVAAGALLVREAGGRVTSYDGGAFSASSGMAVATNGLIHDRVIAELAALQSKP